MSTEVQNKTSSQHDAKLLVSSRFKSRLFSNDELDLDIIKQNIDFLKKMAKYINGGWRSKNCD